MQDPGWYHAPNDPAGTSRYWDGRAWQGEPTTSPGTGEVFYVAVAEETPRAKSTQAPARSAVRASQHSPRSTAREAAFSSTLQEVTWKVSMLKILYLIVLVWLTIDVRNGTGRFEIGDALNIGPWPDDPGTTLLVLCVTIGILMVIQGAAALLRRPWILFTAALPLFIIDCGTFLYA